MVEEPVGQVHLDGVIVDLFDPLDHGVEQADAEHNRAFELTERGEGDGDRGSSGLEWVDLFTPLLGSQLLFAGPAQHLEGLGRRNLHGLRIGLDVVGLRELGTDGVRIAPVDREIRDVVHGHSPFLS